MVDRDYLLGPVSELPGREQWEKARSVLMGEGPVVSDLAAARAAGVGLPVLLGWVARSREQRETDSDWVREIAGVWDSRRELQQCVLEDRLFAMAMSPVVEEVEGVGDDGELVLRSRKSKGLGDLRALDRMLEARGGIYAKAGSGVNVSVNVIRDDDEAYERFKASRRMREVDASRERISEGVVVDVGVGGDLDLSLPDTSDLAL